MRPAHFVRLLTFAAAVAVSAGAAQAQICNAHYPQRATGAACSSSNAAGHITRPTDGVVVCCLRPPQSSSGGRTTYQGSSQQNRYAAGMAAAGMALGIFADIIQMLESAESESSEEDYRAELAARVEGERIDAKRTAAAWNYSGLQQAKIDDFVSAEAHLSAAIKYAIDGYDDEGEELYRRNREIVRSQWYLKEALALKAEGNIAGAEQYLRRASNAASSAKRKDLEQRILAYRRDLHASSPKTRAEPFRERTSCVIVNGQQMCD
jgi:tetratricopeptide (TPR) repeat protein